MTGELLTDSSDFNLFTDSQEGDPPIPFSEWNSSVGVNVTEPKSKVDGYSNYLREYEMERGTLDREVEQDIYVSGLEQLRGIDPEYVTPLDAGTVDTDANLLFDAFGQRAKDDYLSSINSGASREDFLNEINEAKQHLVEQDKLGLASLRRVGADGTISYEVIGGSNILNSKQAINSAVSRGALRHRDMWQVGRGMKEVYKGVNAFTAIRDNQVRSEFSKASQSDEDSGRYKDLLKEAKDYFIDKKEEGSPTALIAKARSLLARGYSRDKDIGERVSRNRFQDSDIMGALEQVATFEAYQSGEAKYESDINNLGDNIKVTKNGAVIPHLNLLLDKGKFDSAIELRKDLTNAQKRALVNYRKNFLTQQFPRYDELFKDSPSDDKWAEAKIRGKQEGLSNGEILENFLIRPKNYSGFKNRMGALADSIADSFTGLAFVIPALFEHKGAIDFLVAQEEDRQNRRELAKAFGDDFGFGMDVTTAIAPMVVDITATALLSAGTLGIGGAAYVGAKQGATLTAKGLTKSMTGSILRKEFGETSSTQAKRLLADKLIRGSSDDVVKTIDAYNKLVASKVVGSKIVQSNAVKATQIGGLFLTSANRSAGATYGAVYTNLEGTHEEKHDAALGAALLGGMATGLITSSFSMFGAGGFEDAFLRGLTFNQQKYVLQRLGRTRLSDIDAQNIIKSHLSKRMKEITPNVFKDVYRRYLKGGTEEFVEEAIDEFVNSFIVDAALHRNTPMMERISGALYAGSIGGVIGQGAASVRSIADKSAAFKRGDIETFRQKEVDLLIEELGEDSPLTQAVLIDKTRELLRSPEGTVLPKEYVEAVESFDKGKTVTEEKFLEQPPETIDAREPTPEEIKEVKVSIIDKASARITTASAQDTHDALEDSKRQAARKHMEIQDLQDDNLDLSRAPETETEAGKQQEVITLTLPRYDKSKGLDLPKSTTNPTDRASNPLWMVDVDSLDNTFEEEKTYSSIEELKTRVDELGNQIWDMVPKEENEPVDDWQNKIGPEKYIAYVNAEREGVEINKYLESIGEMPWQTGEPPTDETAEGATEIQNAEAATTPDDGADIPNDGFISIEDEMDPSAEEQIIHNALEVPSYAPYDLPPLGTGEDSIQYSFEAPDVYGKETINVSVSRQDAVEHIGKLRSILKRMADIGTPSEVATNERYEALSNIKSTEDHIGSIEKALAGFESKLPEPHKSEGEDITPASDTDTPPVNIEEEKIDQGIHDESTKAYEGYSRRREELIAAHAPARDAVREKELALEAHIDKAQKIRRDAGIKSGDSQLYLSFEGQTYGKYSDILADNFETALPEDEVDTRDSRGKRQGFDEDNQQKRKQNRGAPQSAEQTEDTPQAIELAESRRTFLDEEKEIHGELLNAMEELQIIEDDIRQFEDSYATSKWRKKPWVKSVVPTFYTTDIGTSLARKISAKSFVTILKDPTPPDVADALGRQLDAEERGRIWQQALDKADELKAELDNLETPAERKEEIERVETYPKHRSVKHKEAWEKTTKLKEELAAPKTTKKRKGEINKILSTREKKGIGQEPPTEVVTKKGELPDLRAELRQEKNNSLMGLDLDVANADELALDAFNEYKELQNKIPPEVNSDVLSLQAYAVKMIPERGNPNAHYWFPKEQVKAAIATQFIGEGKEGSSTDRYRSIYEDRKKANTGVYSEHDIIFVASNGKRKDGSGVAPVDADGNVRGEYKKIDEAIEARARFVMDTEEHLDNTRKFNTGESALEAYLKGKGYVRKAGTGLWSPAPLQRGFAKEDLKGEGFEVSTKGTPKVGQRYSALKASIPVSELGAFKDFLVARYGKSILKRFNPEKKKSLTVEYLWMAAKGYPEYTNKNKIGKGRGAKAATEGGKFPYWATYKALWKKFFKVTEGAKEEIGEASSGKILTDQFAKTNNNQARAIHEILVEEGYRDPDTLEYLGADVEVKFPVLDTKLEPSEVTETIPRRHLRAEIKLTEDAMASALAARNTEADNYVRLVQSFGKLTAENKDGAKGKDILNNIQEVRVKLALAESRLTNNRNKLEAIMLAQLNDPEVAAIKEASLAFSRYEALSNDAAKKRYDEKEYIELMEGTAAPALSKEEDRGAQNSAEKVKIREAGVSSYNDLDEAQKKEVQDIHRHISEAVGTARTFGIPYRVISDKEYEKSVAEDVDYKAFSLVQLKGRSTMLINPYKIESLVAGKNFLNARSIVRSEVMEEVIHAAVVHEIGSADKGAAIGEIWDNLDDKTKEKTITTYYPKEADATAALKILNDDVEVQEPQVVYMGSVGAVKTAPKEAGINVLRQEGEEHFGNPFSDNEGATRDTIPTGSLAETVAFYEEWLNGTAHTDVKQERRAWVLEQIDNGVLEGANLLYFTDGTSEVNHAEKLKEFAAKRMADNKVKKQKYILGHEYLRMEVQKVTAGLTTEETNDLAGSGIANVLKQYLKAWLRRLSHFFRRDRNNPYVAVAISRVVETLNAMEGGLETQSLPDFDPNSPEDSYNVLNNQFEVGGLPLDGVHGTILESRVEGEKKETLARHGNLAGMLTIPILTTGEYRGKYKGWRKWMNSLVGSVDPRLRALHQSETNLRNTAFREIKKYQIILKGLVEKYYPNGNAPVELFRDITGNGEVLKLHKKTEDAINDTFAKIYAKISEDKGRELHDLREEAKLEGGKKVDTLSLSEGLIETKHYDRVLATHELKDEFIKKELGKQRDMIAIRRNAAIEALGGFEEDGETPKGEIALHLLTLRDKVDAMSEKIKELYPASVEDGGDGKLAATIDHNMEVYLTRGYQLFSDAGYAKKVMGDSSYSVVRNNAAKFFEQQYIEERGKQIFYNQNILEGDKPSEVAVTKVSSIQDAEAIARAELEGSRGVEKGRPSIVTDMMIEFLNSYAPKASGWLGIDPHDGAGRGVGMAHILSSKLKRRADIPEVLRAFMGQEADPTGYDAVLKTYLHTSIIASHMASMKTLLDFGIHSDNKWILQSAEFDALPPKEQENWDQLKITGDDKFSPFKKFIEGNETNALYVPKDLQEALETMGSSTTYALNDAEVVARNMTKVAGWLTGTSMAAKTLGSVGFYIRNSLGNVLFFGPAQGMLAPIKMSRGLWKETVRKKGFFFGGMMEPEQVSAYYSKLERYGILEDELRPKMLEELLFGTQSPQDLMNELERVTKEIGEGGKDIDEEKFLDKLKDGKGVVGKAFTSLKSMSAAMDSFYKIYYYENELSELKKAKAYEVDNNIEDGKYFRMSDEALENLAATKVKDTAQSYSQASPLVQGWSASPIGMMFSPFIRFKGELVRITVNTVSLIMDEIKDSNPVIKKRGYKRLTGMTGVVVGASAVFPFIARMMSDVEDEEDAALRKTMVSYLRGHTYWLMRNKDGDLVSWDLTYLNPFSLVVDPFLRSIEKGFAGGSPASMAATFTKSVIADEFLDEQIFAGALTSFIKNRDPETNKKIWEERDEPLDVFTKGAGFLLKEAFEPRTLKAGREAFKLMGTNPVEDALARIGREFLPAKPYKIDLYQNIRRYLYDVRRETQAISLRKNKVLSPAPMGDAEIKDLVIDEIDHRIRLNKEVANTLKHLTSLGRMTDDEVKELVNGSQFGKRRYKYLLQGRTETPKETHKGLKKKLRDKYEATGDATYLRRERLLDAYFKNMPRFYRHDES